MIKTNTKSVIASKDSSTSSSSSRRIATRYEKHSFTFLAMPHIAAAFIPARN
jgi:hypothetical protein